MSALNTVSPLFVLFLLCTSPVFGRRTQPARAVCTQPYRSLDGSCSASANAEWGKSNRAQFTYFNGLNSKVVANKNLKSPRDISNLLCAQNGSVKSRARLSDFITFFGQFLDHDIGVTPENTKVNEDIEVPDGDTVFSTVDYLTFLRSSTISVNARGTVYRPINGNSAVIDLSAIYGSDEERNSKLRLHKHGLLKHSPNDMLQTNTFGLKNAPRPTDDFFFSGDHRSNEHPVLTSLHIVLSREHNRLAKEVRVTHPTWNDHKLYQAARAINIAQFQRVVFQEFYPAMTGERLPKYRGYSPRTNPAMSVVFSTAAFRIGHSMVNENFQHQRVRHGVVRKIKLHRAFFRDSSFLRRIGVDAFLRPTFKTLAQEVDVKVVDGLRNILFTGINGQTAVDLASHNIQRGRDHGLPSFNEVRRRFFMDPASVFAHFTPDKEVQARLAAAYDTPDDVELWPGLLAERKDGRRAMGKTTIKLWRLDFTRMRNGDRFYYENGFGALADDLRNVRSAKRVMSGLSNMRDIIVRNTGLEKIHVRKDIWHVRC